MRFSEISTRLTGISTPIFGISWNPPTSDVAVARRVISFLEDRRVLYAAIDVEVPEHCVQSVLGIREFLTELLGSGGMSDDLAGSLKGIRAASRKFLENMHGGVRYRYGPIGRPTGRVLSVPAPWRGQQDEPTSPPDRTDEPPEMPGGWNGIVDLHLNQAIGELRGVVGVHVAQLAVKYGIDVEDNLAEILPTLDE